MIDLLRDLNPSQLEAVRHVEGPLLVLAGPGSGKTRVITSRIAYLLLEMGIPASDVLAVTFTNKAADEMRHRLQRMVGGVIPWTMTFHRFCSRILRENARRVNLSPSFSILDQKDRLRVLTDVLRGMSIDTLHFTPEAVERKISSLKNELITPEAFSDLASDLFDRCIEKVYPVYQQRLLEQNAVDFDDLLFHIGRLLVTDANFRAELDRRFQYVLVDEYQDTNYSQYVIAKGISHDYPNLCATGDPDQSIYSWRGANLNNILCFEEDYPAARVVRLELNYRSTGRILEVADQLIRHNIKRKDKRLRTENGEGSRVVVTSHVHDKAEATAHIAAIADAVDQGYRQYSDFALLVRTLGAAREIEMALKSRRIPYQVVGGFSYFDRREVRDLVGFCRLILNPRDDEAFRRVVNLPARGVGETTLERLMQWARDRGQSMLEALASLEHCSAIRAPQRKGLLQFRTIMDQLAHLVEETPEAALAQILTVTEYEKVLDDCEERERQDRLAILNDLVAGAELYSRDTPNATLADYVESLSLISSADNRDATANVVSLMTLHAAKGLEFPVVFLPAFEAGILPHERSTNEGNEEEERRLAFVGITRAMQELHISYCNVRTYAGRTRMCAPSSFLTEMPEESLERRDRIVAPRPTFRRYDQEDIQEFPPDDADSQEIPVRGGTVESSAADVFRKGMLVRHPRFGNGQIVQLEGTGANRKATVNFPSVGPKRLQLAFAPLEPV